LALPSRTGDRVNLEVDQMARYAARLIGAGGSGRSIWSLSAGTSIFP
jgi:riboflavin synthase alpha subunit